VLFRSDDFRKRSGIPKRSWWELNWFHETKPVLEEINNDPMKRGIKKDEFDTGYIALFNAVLLKDAHMRDKIIDHVIRSLDDAVKVTRAKKVTLVGRSLGSVIAIDAIKRIQHGIADVADFETWSIITYGSPLRDFLITKKYGGYSWAAPKTIKGWTNFVDPRDTIGKGISDMIPDVKDVAVDNTKLRYLAIPGFAGKTLRRLERHIGYENREEICLAINRSHSTAMETPNATPQ
jgi:hypothetical protein